MTRFSIIRLIVLSCIAFLIASCASDPTASSPTLADTQVAIQSTATPAPVLAMPLGKTPTPAPQVVWPTATPTEVGVAEVEVGDYFFEPQIVTITLGMTVKWMPVGDLHHSILSKERPRVLEGGTGGAGSKPFTFEFRSPGTYAYFCDNHPSEMTGWIVVVDDD